MRRTDRERDADFALAVADKCEWATVSVVTPEGEPYAVPVSIVRDGDTLYFHTAKEGRKIDAIKHDPRVWVVCVGDVERAVTAFTTGYESAMFEGECKRGDGRGGEGARPAAALSKVHAAEHGEVRLRGVGEPCEDGSFRCENSFRHGQGESAESAV